MWTIDQFTNETQPKQPVSFADGQPLDAVRGPEGASFRLWVGNLGFLDFTDAGHQPGGQHYWQLIVGDNIYWYDGQGVLDLTVNADASYSITGDGNNFSGSLSPPPGVSAQDVAVFQKMITNKYVPYQNIPDEPGKTTAEIKALGLQYFPFSPNSFELAMAVYDWTTADFTRIDFIRLFTYTMVSGNPLDMDSVANAIWSADWPPYTPHNADYMNSFMMVPADSLTAVQAQLKKKARALNESVAAESNMLLAALNAMPRITTIAKPMLYSGQVSIANLGNDHFATYFLQLPENSDPSLPPLEMPLSDALSGFLAVGNTVTLKSFVSFTDSEKDAMHYSNGIVVKISPPRGALIWESNTYITPLSDGPDKIEYLFKPGTELCVQHIRSLEISGKTITEISMRLV